MKLYKGSYGINTEKNFRRGTMKMVHGKKSDYQSPQVQIISVCENVLNSSLGMEDYDFNVDTEDWD
jgi:hypothetical protein